uniref:Uncharacterized protein n=1 Tax=Anguilla anguilla TaxID=7936 RepID=A0A0E9WA66_ANGAN
MRKSFKRFICQTPTVRRIAVCRIAHHKIFPLLFFTYLTKRLLPLLKKQMDFQ